LLNICIAAPFWLSWWFISLVVLFILGIVFYTLRRRKIMAIEKENKEKQITEAKFEALEPDEPSFFFNALN
jgi:cytochrome c biogenesis protein ResB